MFQNFFFYGFLNLYCSDRKWCNHWIQMCLDAFLAWNAASKSTFSAFGCNTQTEQHEQSNPFKVWYSMKSHQSFLSFSLLKVTVPSNTLQVMRWDARPNVFVFTTACKSHSNALQSQICINRIVCLISNRKLNHF